MNDFWIDLSIPLMFNGPQPNVYGCEPAVSKSVSYQGKSGDSRKGGACNLECYQFVSHCNGTHTECVGHITHERVSILKCLLDVTMSALLITISPVDAQISGEHYPCKFEDGNLLITAALLENAIKLKKADALIIRTLPNSNIKLSKFYKGKNLAFFSNEAMYYINQLGFKHLLVDLPSIDRLDDKGLLSNHRIFWGMEIGSFATPNKEFCSKTISELIYVPPSVKDGLYELNLQIAPFDAESAPSRPLIRSID